MYDLLIDFDKDKKDLSEKEKESIYSLIRSKFHSNRNLCEDLIKITAVEEQPISVCAQIEVDPKMDEELVHAKVLYAIQNYFSPSLSFYSIKKMFDKGI